MAIYGTQFCLRDKPQHHLNQTAVGALPWTALATGPHELHRARRAPLSRFFSKAQILRMEDDVHRFATMVVDKILRNRGQVFDVRQAYNCFTADIVTLHAFGEPNGFVAQSGWTPNLASWGENLMNSTHLLRHSSLARGVAQIAPLVAGYFNEDVRALRQFLEVAIPGYVQAASVNPENDRVIASLSRLQNKNTAVPGAEMTPYRLAGETTSLLIAGTETTSGTLAVITYYLLARRDIFAALQADLDGLSPEALRWTELERRPYLWALVHEALRHSPPVCSRLMRVPSGGDLIYTPRDGSGDSIVVPRGFSIGMSPIISHHDQNLYPEPQEFRPERWLVKSEDGSLAPNEEMRKNLIAFAKGTRICLGENLAMCEIFIMTAMMALRVIPYARLHGTTDDDMAYDHDKIAFRTRRGAIAVNIVVS